MSLEFDLEHEEAADPALKPKPELPSSKPGLPEREIAPILEAMRVWRGEGGNADEEWRDK